MIPLAELSKPKAYLILFYLLVTLVVSAFPFQVQAQTVYHFSLSGPVDESSANWIDANVTVTFHFSGGGGADDTIEFNGTYIYNTTNPVRYFAFECNNTGELQHREFWLTDADTASAIAGTFSLWLAFSTQDTAEYTISFMDHVGVLKTYPYVEIRHIIFSGYYTVERRIVDAQNIIVATLDVGERYQIWYGDDNTYTYFGDLTTTAVTGIQLVIRDIDFPKETLLLYEYVHAYAVRDFLIPTGAITISFEDITNQTSSVTISITNDDTGAVAYTNTFTNQTFSYTWTDADNSVDYEVVISVDHMIYGDFEFNHYFLGEYEKASNPFDLSFMGSIGIETAWIIPAILIIFVAGLFSELTSEVAAIITVITAIVLYALGWLDIAPTAIVSALALSVLAAMMIARRRLL